MTAPARAGLLAAALSGALFFGPCAAAAAGQVRYWGQVQAHLESFNGAPLISANWSGRYRPYVFVADRFIPLVAIDRDLSGLDLYRPLPFSSTEILLAGSESGQAEYDLFTYDMHTRALVNLTRTPAVDEGHLCASPEGRLLAFRAGDEERVARLTDMLEPLRQDWLPGFEDCRWITPRMLLGVARYARGYRLYRCDVTEDAVGCQPRPALEDVDSFTAFLRGPGTSIIARRRDDLFRTPFLLRDPFTSLVADTVGRSVRGDVLDVGDGAVRWGFHSRYTSSLVPHSVATVYATRRIGRTDFAIVATDRMPRTLARAGRRGWDILPHPSVVVPENVPLPREVWMRSTGGELYQAFYFGPPAPERMVVWWHGGPSENVSPRFNPYYFRLNELGFGVLAMNYPGSTGRGSEYEGRFDDRWLADCLDAVWVYLRDNHVRVVISWSVSSGNTLQGALLRRGLGVSALVDQAGWGRSTLLEETGRRGIPFFTIRGRNDRNAPIERVDYWYAGGHDVTTTDDFAALFAAVENFLRNAPPVRDDSDVDRSARLMIDLPASGDDAPATDPEERALEFELATQLARECFRPGEVAFSRNADVALGPAGRGAERVRAWLRRHGDRAFVTVRLRAAASSRRTPGVVLQPIDFRTAGERARLRVQHVGRDGTLVRPRLQTLARALCPRLRALALALE